MQITEPNRGTSSAARRFKWPWFVLAAVLLGVVLAILWMSHEVARTRRLRDFNAPAQGPN